MSDEYEVAHGMYRNCEHAGCTRIITNFAYPKDQDPRTVAVWCRVHRDEAVIKCCVTRKGRTK
jgi:hypothetical protein